MDQFNQTGRVDVLSTLNYLATAMDEFESSTNRAASAMGNLADAIRDKNAAEYDEDAFRKALIAGGGLSGSQYKKGKTTKYAEGGVNDFTGMVQMDGTPSASEVIFNAIDAKKLYNLVHNSPDITSTIMGRMTERINAMNPFNQMNLAAPPSFMGDITVNQGDVVVQGGMDKSALQNVKQILTDNANLITEVVCKNIMKQQHLRGHGNMVY